MILNAEWEESGFGYGGSEGNLREGDKWGEAAEMNSVTVSVIWEETFGCRGHLKQTLHELRVNGHLVPLSSLFKDQDAFIIDSAWVNRKDEIKVQEETFRDFKWYCSCLD